MDPTPLVKTRLSKFVRNDATCPDSLRAIFMNSAAKVNGLGLPDTSRVRLPIEIYDAYWTMHEKSLRLVDALETVLNDPLHNQIMSLALSEGYKMPDIDFFRHELNDFKAALIEFDCYQIEMQKNGYIEIPIKTARTLNGIMSYNCFMIARIFDGVFNTDYMKQFTEMKESGAKYQGVSALQETLDLLVSMARVLNETEKQIDMGRQKKNWPQLVN